MPTEVEENDGNSVSVPSIGFPLSEDAYVELIQAIPNDYTSTLRDGSYGVNNYLQVRMFVFETLKFSITEQQNYKIFESHECSVPSLN